MRSVRQTYILHAEVVRLGDHSEAFDDATAGHPLERRLNRTERAAATFGGRIQLRFAEGMRILFDDAWARNWRGAGTLNLDPPASPYWTDRSNCLAKGFQLRSVAYRSRALEVRGRVGRCGGPARRRLRRRGSFLGGRLSTRLSTRLGAQLLAQVGKGRIERLCARGGDFPSTPLARLTGCCCALTAHPGA